MSFIDNLERGNAISQTLSITSTADAASATNGGALTVAGGVAVAKKLFVGTTITSNDAVINGPLSTTSTATFAAPSDGRFVKAESSADLAKISFGSKDNSGGAVCASIVSSNSGVNNEVVLNAAAGAGKITHNSAYTQITSTTDATSLSDNGALKVEGGAVFGSGKTVCLSRTKLFSQSPSYYTYTGGNIKATSVADPIVVSITCNTPVYGGIMCELDLGGTWSGVPFACSKWIIAFEMTPSGFSNNSATQLQRMDSVSLSGHILYSGFGGSAYVLQLFVHMGNGTPATGVFSYTAKVTTFPDSVFTVSFL